MPLELGGIETERPKVLVWDPANPKEAAEGEAEMKRLMGNGFLLRSYLNGEVTLDPPALDPNKGVFRILSQNGDDRVVWDRSSPKEVKEAYKKFKELTDAGHRAYSVLASGKRGHRIDTFDPGLSEIVFVPHTVPG